MVHRKYERAEKLEDFFEDHNEEFLKFENIKPERRLHARPDLNAFLLLDRLVSGDRDMVSCAGHDEIGLDVDPDMVILAATEEDLLDLIRCGVRFDDGYFQMFV